MCFEKKKKSVKSGLVGLSQVLNELGDEGKREEKENGGWGEKVGK